MNSQKDAQNNYSKYECVGKLPSIKLCFEAFGEEGVTFFLDPPACRSPFKMLASMASISFTTKLNSLSAKLNTSFKEKITVE